jgi:hypothetical protein
MVRVMCIHPVFPPGVARGGGVLRRPVHVLEECEG